MKKTFKVHPMHGGAWGVVYKDDEVGMILTINKEIEGVPCVHISPESIANDLYPMQMIGGGIDSKTVRQLQQNAFLKGFKYADGKTTLPKEVEVGFEDNSAHSFTEGFQESQRIKMHEGKPVVKLIY